MIVLTVDQFVPGEAIFAKTPSGVALTRADPVIWVSAGFFDEISKGSSYAVVDGDILTFSCVNRTVIYRIGEYDFQRDAYLCSWPD